MDRIKELVAAVPELESIQRVVEGVAELAIQDYSEYLEERPIKPKWGGAYIDSEKAEKLARIVHNSGLWGTVDELIRDVLRDIALGRIPLERLLQKIGRSPRSCETSPQPPPRRGESHNRRPPVR